MQKYGAERKRGVSFCIRGNGMKSLLERIGYSEKYLKSSFPIIHAGQFWNRLSPLWLEAVKKKNDKIQS